MKKTLLNSKQLGLLFALIALFSWGIHGPAGRFLAISGVNMNFVVAARFFIGTFVFAVYLLIKKEFRLNLKQNFLLVFFVSLIGLAGNSALYHFSLIYLPATLVMILENLAPVFVMLFSFFLLKIKASKVQMLTLFTSFLGVCLIVFSKNSFQNIHPKFGFGIFLGVLTGITFGFYTFFSAVLVKPYKNNPTEIIRFLFKIFLFSSILYSPALFNSKPLPANSSQWFWLIEMGVFQSGLSYIFWNLALSRISANTASILFLLTIVFTTINEILFLGLKLNLPLVLGGSIIIGSGWFLQKKAKNK